MINKMIDNNKPEVHLSIRYCSAPNIALVKYWGKYHEGEILPINHSIGITLNTNDLSTTTTCTFSNTINEDQFRLNGKRVEIGGRMKKVLVEIRKAARKTEKFSAMAQEEWNSIHFCIYSQNSFPTASGMASSASGFSCLATALNGLFGNILQQRQVSRLARWGSGSAARAVYGGLVKWQGVDQHYLWKKAVEGEELQELSKKCISYTVKPAKDLSYLKVIILLTEDKQKEVSSTEGMKISLQTSSFIKLRNKIAKDRIDNIMDLLGEIDSARKEKDTQVQFGLFSRIAEQIMRDSNQFHSICMDSYPPIFYLNSFSKMIISIVHNVFNKQTNKCKVAYSFDAGAHAFLFVHQAMLQQILHYFAEVFQLKQEVFNEKAKSLLSKNVQAECLYSKYSGEIINPTQIWVTDVGDGAFPL